MKTQADAITEESGQDHWGWGVGDGQESPNTAREKLTSQRRKGMQENPRWQIAAVAGKRAHHPWGREGPLRGVMKCKAAWD